MYHKVTVLHESEAHLFEASLPSALWNACMSYCLSHFQGTNVLLRDEMILCPSPPIFETRLVS